MSATATSTIAFVTGQGNRPGVTSTVVIQREPFVATVASDDDLARRRRVTLAELTRAGPFVEFREGIELRVEVDAAFAAEGVSRERRLELGQIVDLLGA